MIIGIDPKVDYAFKRLLGCESTKPILIDVLNLVLDLQPGERIEEVELLNPFNPKESLYDKLSIVDVKARDQKGQLFIVEMQVLDRAYYEKRVLYYSAKTYQQQLHEGEDYEQLRPTISVSFLNHEMFPGVPDYHLCFQLLEKRHGLLLTGDLEFHFCELPKFKKTLDDLDDRLDIWLYFLRHAEKMDKDALPPVLQDPLVLRAMEELQMLSQNEVEREQYETRRKAQLDYNTDMKVSLRKGENIGVIHVCERILSRSETPTENLERLSLQELTRMASELQQQVLTHRSPSD